MSRYSTFPIAVYLHNFRVVQVTTLQSPQNKNKIYLFHVIPGRGGIAISTSNLIIRLWENPLLGSPSLAILVNTWTDILGKLPQGPLGTERQQWVIGEEE